MNPGWKKEQKQRRVNDDERQRRDGKQPDRPRIEGHESRSAHHGLGAEGRRNDGANAYDDGEDDPAPERAFQRLAGDLPRMWAARQQC